MRIKKTSVTTPTTGPIVNAYSTNQTEAYSAEYINNLKNILPKNAGAHNSIYRGEDITDLFYNGTLTTQIAAGTFDDIFIGDYIIGNVSGRKYLVADINYRLYTGSNNQCTTPHVLMIPEKIMGLAKMNSSNTATGAYNGSQMHNTNLTAYKTIITNDFGSGHILTHDNLFAKAISNQYESDVDWYSSTVDLMNELMVYGSNINHNNRNGTSYAVGLLTTDKSQLALFRLDKSKIIGIDDNNVRKWTWLRDVGSSTSFCMIDASGHASLGEASNSYGVRPAFLVY